ncbi:unnamed protein product, partial [Meganyctiphanes norvegica]
LVLYCPLYDQGELRGIKHHGDKWLNDGSDCEICTCFNGEKRCYYHYCNGLTEGYMTPPSVLGPLRPADQPHPGYPPLDDEDLLDNDVSDDREGSGMGLQLPFPDDEYYMQYFSNKVSSKHKLVIPQHGSAYEGKTIKKGNDDDKNPQDNETHDQFVDDFCGVPCRKACPHGYKMDQSTGCRKCKCIKCQSLKYCLLKCPHGLHIDEMMCTLDKLSNEIDIQFTSGFEITPYQLFPPEEILIGTDGEPSDGEKASTDPACNNTGVSVEGCRVASGWHGVGEVWTLGSCVTCRCATPGNTECNVTQCPRLACPMHRTYTPKGECCPLCTETVSPGPFSEFGQGYSRTTSRVPHHLIPTRPHAVPDIVIDQSTPTHRDQKNIHHHHHQQEEEEFIFTHTKPLENDGMIKSAVPGSSPDASQLCVIILPVLVVMALVCFLIARWWRKSHRDKYDINSYRHEETEKLQAVKTADDNTSVRHV